MLREIVAVSEGWTVFDESDEGGQVRGPRGSTGVFPDAFVALSGDIRPVVAEGRAPLADDEVAVGRSKLRGMGAGIGDTVTMTGAAGEVAFRVVGIAVRSGVDEADDGFTMTVDGLRRLGEPSRFAVFVRFAEGVDRSAVIDRYGFGPHESEACFGHDCLEFDEPRAPSEVGNIGQLGRLPLWTALILTALGIAAVLHAGAVTMRRWRKDLAIHRALGFTRRQVFRAVSSAGVLTGLIGAVVGLVLGFVVGRFVHRRLVVGVGAVADTVVPAAAFLAAAAAIAVCVGLFLPVGIWAARQRPSAILRTE